MPVTFLEHNLVLKTNIAIGTFQAYFLSSPHAVFDVASLPVQMRKNHLQSNNHVTMRDLSRPILQSLWSHLGDKSTLKCSAKSCSLKKLLILYANNM